MKKPREIPVYLFTGFLEAGKTKLIQESLEDPNFNKGEATLILMCEDGIEEYDLSAFPKPNVYLHRVEKEEDLTEASLIALTEQNHIQRVMVEYNGMWQLDAFYNAMPEGWLVYQELMLADATTFLGYNANMRSLVVDKLQSCEMVVFNRCSALTDRMALHKIVRAVSRRASIGYETEDGTFTEDTIEDPLPFDINAPVVEIADRDYALFYRDLSEDMAKYEGKNVSFLGMIGREKSLPEDTCAIGRMVMVCCEADTAYRGLGMKCDAPITLQTRDWVRVKGTIHIEYNKLYRGKGPVLHVTEMKNAAAPEQEVATFY